MKERKNKNTLKYLYQEHLVLLTQPKYQKFHTLQKLQNIPKLYMQK